MKNLLTGSNSSLATVEDKSVNSKTSIQIIRTDAQSGKKKNWGRKEQDLSDK